MFYPVAVTVQHDDGSIDSIDAFPPTAGMVVIRRDQASFTRADRSQGLLRAPWRRGAPAWRQGPADE